ncbi:MAG: hypothetical protein HC913_07100 [Microscillaceae bacterium]|nr:hypothetical protein [Microscillaceae bacterium]
MRKIYLLAGLLVLLSLQTLWAQKVERLGFNFTLPKGWNIASQADEEVFYAVKGLAGLQMIAIQSQDSDALTLATIQFLQEKTALEPADFEKASPQQITLKNGQAILMDMPRESQASQETFTHRMYLCNIRGKRAVLLFTDICPMGQASKIQADETAILNSLK